MTFPARRIAHVDVPDPFGDVTLAPASMTGQTESQLARAMAKIVRDYTPDTASQALTQLRTLFPAAPLPLRVAALNSLMRR